MVKNTHNMKLRSLSIFRQRCIARPWELRKVSLLTGDAISNYKQTNFFRNQSMARTKIIRDSIRRKPTDRVRVRQRKKERRNGCKQRQKSSNNNSGSGSKMSTPPTNTVNGTVGLNGVGDMVRACSGGASFEMLTQAHTALCMANTSANISKS